MKRFETVMAKIKAERMLRELHLRVSAPSSSSDDPSKANSMAYIYEKMTACLTKPPHERDKEELNILEPWVRKKSRLFGALQRETVLDVIKHCEFLTKQKNEPVIIQGEKGYSFYIVLRGSVAVLIKENTEEEVDLSELTRAQLGTQVSVLGEGFAFGELALISEDCVRTASIVADEPCDLVVIHRDLYNRSVARVVKQEYEDKYNFVDGCPIFKDWAQRWKKHLAIAMTKTSFRYEDVITRQGEKAERMYFILSGECKLIVDPETQPDQFKDFIDHCAPLMTDTKDAFARFSRKDSTTNQQRVRRMMEEKQRENVTSPALECMTVTPSVIRKQMLFHRQHSEKVTLSLLGAGQVLGDVEFLLNLNKYHASAICTHQTEVLWIHKVHFERLFRKRNPQSLRIMAELIKAQIAGRTSSREGLIRKLPFFRCLQLKVNHLTEEKKRVKEEDPNNLPQVNMDNMLIRQRSYSQMDYRLPEPSRRPPQRSHTPMDGFSFRPAAQSAPMLPIPQGLPDNVSGYPISGEAANNADVIIVDRPLINPREGIFVKLMQITNPETTADHLYIDSEEFDYLVQLRRRIAKEFQDFSMGKKVPYSEGLEGTIERPCRKGSRATTRQLAKRMFPMLLGSKPKGGGSAGHSAGAARGGVRLPQF